MAAPRPITATLARPARVTGLLAAIVVLSLVDLVLTLGHMSGPGMFESNPLVAALAGSGSAFAVVDFKVLTLLVGVSLLYRTRRHVSAEIGAWIMTAVLCLLTVQWVLYMRELEGMDQALLVALADADKGWVQFP